MCDLGCLLCCKNRDVVCAEFEARIAEYLRVITDCEVTLDRIKIM